MSEALSVIAVSRMASIGRTGSILHGGRAVAARARRASVRADEGEVQRVQLVLDGGMGAPVDPTPPVTVAPRRVKPAAVPPAPIEHDVDPILVDELALQVRAELGLVSRHDEEVTRHARILS
jgi:hypothetical protein